jgi:ubiquinone/menaquinone biosynthesis C-methylase UbiE
MSHDENAVYVCGHSEDELERLARQAAIYEDITRGLLARAHIGAGMYVVDAGCGAGDVSIVVAELVGPTGRVLGIDRSEAAIATAWRRIVDRGFDGRVSFLERGIEASDLPRPVDAIVGRFVLMHQADPAAALRALARHVRPGGIVAFLESDMRATVAGVHSSPHSAAYDRVLRWITAALIAARAHVDMGVELRRAFLEAGLTSPSVSMHAFVDGGPGCALVPYILDSVASIRPLSDRLGVETLSDEILDAVRVSLEAEAAKGTTFVSPLVVGAWTRV